MLGCPVELTEVKILCYIENGKRLVALSIM